eukprot:9481529-Pyramimonas_sp.AAC.1
MRPRLSRNIGAGARSGCSRPSAAGRASRSAARCSACASGPSLRPRRDSDGPPGSLLSGGPCR